MAGVKGRSGPPGNLNSAKHGMGSWLRRRALPINKQHVGKLVEDYLAQLTRCKGGPAAVTEVETGLIDNAGRAVGMCLLILEEAASRGLVREVDGGTWDLAPGLARLVGFLNAERQALLALGLDRRERELPDVFEYIRSGGNGTNETPAPERPAGEQEPEP
jgi:hypothetical protein